MKTNRTLKLITLTAAIFGFAATSFAQETASASASANIVTPIDITKTADMNFGNVAVQSTNGGTVVLAPAGTRTRTDGVTLPATTGTVSAAAFTVTGVAGYTYTVTLPASTTVTSGENNMTVNHFTSSLGEGNTGTITGGSVNITVGATLNVAAAQPAGLYTTASNFEVTVNYN